MKKMFSLLAITAFVFAGITASAQDKPKEDKSKRPEIVFGHGQGNR